MLGSLGHLLPFQDDAKENFPNNLFEEGILVSQFTGLRDKNGKEIWEGDVLKTTEGRAVVEFYEGEYCLDWLTFGDWEGTSLTGLKSTLNGGYVIGSIYENSEAIEKSF